MKRILNLLTLGLLFALLASSCQKDSVTDNVEDDESVVEQMAMAEDEAYMYDLGIDDKNEDNMFDGYNSFGNPFGKTSAIMDSVIRFGRIVHRAGLRRLDIRRIAPDTIKIFSVRQFSGKFVIFEKGEDTTGTKPIIIHRKDMNHVVRRNAVFAKTNPNDENPHRRWKLVAISNGQGNSVPEPTIRINQVTITNSNGDSIVITEPLHNLMTLEEVPTFNPGDIVTVEVKLTNSTANPVDILGNGSTETVLLHFGTSRRHHARKRFDYDGVDPETGDNIYVGSWEIHQRPFRVYHAIVDAIDNGTIYDNDAATYPYNSATWSSPYRVVETD